MTPSPGLLVRWILYQKCNCLFRVIGPDKGVPRVCDIWLVNAVKSCTEHNVWGMYAFAATELLLADELSHALFEHFGA